MTKNNYLKGKPNFPRLWLQCYFCEAFSGSFMQWFLLPRSDCPTTRTAFYLQVKESMAPPHGGWTAAPGSVEAAPGRWRPAAPAQTAAGSSLSAPGSPSFPPAPPARAHSFALWWPVAPWGPRWFLGCHPVAAGSPSGETRSEVRAETGGGGAVWGGAHPGLRPHPHLELDLHCAQVFLGLHQLAVGVAQLNCYLIEISLHLLLEPQGVVAAPDLSIQHALHGLCCPLAVSLQLLDLFILLSNLAVKLGFYLTQL